MVWFQCEDCGDNLKKPKLAGHFRQCSAFKLSCIDCGQVFGKHEVEGHTQCITEAEKYGPKGQAKTPNGANTKPGNEKKQKPEVDINVGLSERPPWFCSLCNTKATSKQALLIHADGKKHRAKARAFHASKQPQLNDTAETKTSTEKNANNGVAENKDSGESRDQDPSKVENNNNALEPNKKRKHESSENSDAQHKASGADIVNGQAIEITGSKKEKGSKKAKHSETLENVEPSLAKEKIQWKKLITSALKSNEGGSMKLKKLTKFVLKSLKESGFTEDKKQMLEVLEQKVNSSSRFIVDGKYVRLATST